MIEFLNHEAVGGAGAEMAGMSVAKNFVGAAGDKIGSFRDDGVVAPAHLVERGRVILTASPCR